MVAHEPLEFVFYAKDLSAAASLADDLEKLGYDVAPIDRFEPLSDYCISGVTTPMAGTEAVFDAWYEQMRDLAIENGCHFDGCGTPGLDDEGGGAPEVEAAILSDLEARLALDPAERAYVKWLVRKGKMR